MGAAQVIPTGSVTLMFTDIEGSTKLLQRTGERYGEVLTAHHRVLRDAIGSHHGYEVDTAGDGFFVTFAAAGDALRCAFDLQRGLAVDPITAAEDVRVRVGVHTGDVKLVDGDYLGLAVHHAARVSGAAHGGQVLVSDTTRGLVGDEFSFVDLGLHQLKDLARPVHLYQLAHPDLPSSFPPIRSLARGESNLPRPRTSLVGRESEVAAVAETIRSGGLITLTGPGGCGKTRLAIAAAAAVQNECPGGVHFVDLRAAVTDVHVEEALAAAVGVHDPTSPTGAVDRAVARIGSQRAVVVLDNCEHVVSAAADLADRLLADCRALTVVATSRDLLGLEDEQARRVASLKVPPETVAIDDPNEYSALVLFAERAGRVAPHFDLHRDADMVARICRRLDGIPLAIELAAARLRHMDLVELEVQLSDMFRVLVGSERRSLQRHQTLEAVVGWSFDLLDERDRAVLADLSTFVGSFSAADAAAVAGLQVSDALYRLVDRSLVELVDDGRYRLLETIRAYAQRELHQSGRAEAVRDRHVAHLVEIVERAGSGMRRERAFEAADEAAPLVEDIRAALDWAGQSGKVDLALRLSADAPQLWAITGRWSDMAAAEACLDASQPGDHPLLHARAVAGYAWGGCFTGDAGAIARAEQAIAEFDAIGPSAEGEELLGWALVARALSDAIVGDASGVTEMADAAEKWWADHPEAGSAGRAYVLSARAWAANRGGDLPTGRRGLAEAVSVARASGNGMVLGVTLFWSGIAGMHAADYPAARASYEEGLPYFRRIRHKLWLQWELDHLASCCAAMDDLAAARAYAEEGLTVSRTSGLAGRGNYFSLLSTLAAFEVHNGNPAQAAMYLRESVELARRLRPHNAVVELAALSGAEMDQDHGDEARRSAAEAVELVGPLGPVESESGAVVAPPVSRAVAAAGYVIGCLGDPQTGLALRAAGARLQEGEGPLPSALTRTVQERRTDRLRAMLNPAAADAAWEKGLSMDEPLAAAAAALGLS